MNIFDIKQLEHNYFVGKKEQKKVAHKDHNLNNDFLVCTILWLYEKNVKIKTGSNQYWALSVKFSRKIWPARVTVTFKVKDLIISRDTSLSYPSYLKFIQIWQNCWLHSGQSVHFFILIYLLLNYWMKSNNF
jgi:hypothetical protein